MIRFVFIMLVRLLWLFDVVVFVLLGNCNCIKICLSDIFIICSKIIMRWLMSIVILVLCYFFFLFIFCYLVIDYFSLVEFFLYEVVNNCYSCCVYYFY